jgi:adenylate cyclase
MAIIDELNSEIEGTLNEKWTIRNGTVVPEVEDVSLSGAAVKLDATILFADLADSTKLAILNQEIAAKVFKMFLAASSRIIRHNGGQIRSFDGDRVMGIFIGTSKNTSATKCALNINYAFTEIIKPKLKVKYEIFRSGSYDLSFCTGVDVSPILSVRSGIRNSNDLIWVGKAPNIAAKLSGIRDSPYNTYITKEVYDNMHESSKITTDKSANMWQKLENWNKVQGLNTVYKSHYYWKP